jgi:hypothetical protein
VNERLQVERTHDGDASLSLDRRHMPLVIITWRGSTTLEMVEQTQVWLDESYAQARALDYGGVVFISDASEVGVPSADARRRVLELRHDPELLIKVIIVTPAHNKMVRGILNGIAWVLGDSRYVVSNSLAHALEIASRAFEQRGLAVPSGLEQLCAEQREQRRA